MSQLSQQARLPISPASGGSSSRILSPSKRIAPIGSQSEAEDDDEIMQRASMKRKAPDGDDEGDEDEQGEVTNDGVASEADQPARKRARVLVEASKAQEDSSMDRNELDDLIEPPVEGDEETMDPQDDEEGEGVGMIKPDPDFANDDDPGPSNAATPAANDHDQLDEPDTDFEGDGEIMIKPDPEEDVDGSQDGADQEQEQDQEEQEDEWEEYVDEEGQVHRRLRHMLRVPFERGDDGFVSGSILRLKFKNFLTYDAVEFFPGPHLNMIIGPNGTGKSTIACGIALASGFHPKLLGRAHALSSFAKQGSEGICFVEVEFKNRGNKPNLVIRREFTNQNDKSTFFVADQQATAVFVHETIRDLGIQVDNLCSFLPQDKVAEFAGMSPEQLLVETMKAAGNPKLPDWHASLIKDGRAFELADADLKENEKLLAKVDAKVAELEPEISRLRERKELKTKIVALGLSLPYQRYTVAKQQITQSRVRKDKLKHRYQVISAKMQPLEQLKAEWESRKEKAEKKMAVGLARSKELNTAIGAIPTKLDTLVDNAEAIQQELRELKHKDRQRRDNITLTKRRIVEVQAIVEPGPPEMDIAPIDRQRRSCQEKINELKAADRDMETTLQGFKQRGSHLHDAVTRARQQLQQYQDSGAKRRQALAAWQPGCGYAMHWIDANRNRFEKEVYFPTAVSVTVSDPGFAPSVEASLTQTQKITFICQTQRDYDTLNELNDRGHRVKDQRGKDNPVRIGVYYLSDAELNDDTVRSPIPHERLLELGLEGWALDFCQADPVVKAFLKNHCRLDEAAVGRNLILDPGVESSGLSRYFVWDPDHVEAGRPAPRGYQTSIQISRYGGRKAMSATQPMSRAQSFVNPVNDDDVKACEETIGKLTQDRRAHEEEIAALTASKPKRRAEMENLSEKMSTLETEKKQKQKAMREFEKAKIDLVQAQAKLIRLENEPSAQDTRGQLNRKFFKTVKERAKLVEQHAELCQSGAALIDKHLEHNFAALAAKANVEAIAEQAAERSAKLEAAQEAHREALNFVKEMTAAAKAIGEIYKNRSQELAGTAEFALHESQRDAGYSVQELEQMMVTAETEFALLPDMDRGAEMKLRQSRTKQKELKAAVALAEKKHKKLVLRLTELKENFEPSLNDLVRSVSERFSDAMDKLKCAGEVRVRKSDNYEKWAIEIKVKFRDNEDLQILTAQRQSGGERSLSTIMYLMSLTDLARAPFSLVDEINQGMDQRAERAVHDQLVRTTNQADGGQYFLITPKLLTNLDYHSRMKVLVINNGEWLPDETPERPGTGQISDLLSFAATKIGPPRGGRARARA